MAARFFKGLASELSEALSQDYDRFFSYYTKQQVNVLDRTLGFTNVVIQLLIVSYVVGYVFIAERGYLEPEAAQGVIVTHISGDAVGVSSGKKAGDRYFSADELTYPGLERGNVFIATKIIMTQQNRGVCEDESMPCLTKDDCSKEVGAECTSNRVCKEPSWCPVLQDGEPANEVYKLETSNEMILVKSAIQYKLLAPEKVFHESMEPVMYPKAGFNAITLRQILLECSPPVRYEEVSELGAAIEVQWVWNCNVDFPTCEKKMVARRLDVTFDDQNIGFNFKWPFYNGGDTTMNGEERELKQMYGIRLYFRTVGTGQKVSMGIIIFKMSTGLALVGFAPIIADLMMLNCFKLSKKYTARKYLYSQDFGDYFDSVGAGSDDDMGVEADEVEDEQEDEEWRRRMDEEDE